MVFPEGARGTAKLYKERHSLVRFGTGFIRLALETRCPIIPFAFDGALQSRTEALAIIRATASGKKHPGALSSPIDCSMAFSGEPVLIPSRAKQPDVGELLPVPTEVYCPAIHR
jgi:1-acyl-sn-glycerol-3-phosphate acyltransferase